MDRNSFFFASFVLLQPYTMHFCTISLRNNLLATKQNDVTIIPSLLFSLVGFCSPQEVKFNVFCSSIHGNEKWPSKYFLPSLSVHCVYSIKQKKHLCHIHFKGELREKNDLFLNDLPTFAVSIFDY